MNLVVVGAGEMGRWIADTVDAAVAFTDADPETAADAAADREARAVDPDTEETFDAVCLAVPMSAVADAVADYAPNAERAIFDISGIMADPLAAMADHAPDCERASLHPLFAPPRVPGNVAVVPDADGPVLDAIYEDMREAGNTVFETTAAEHDDAMETVQAGAHTAVLAYALVAGDVREEFATPVSAQLTDVAATVTEGSPDVYSEIQSAFDGADAIVDAAERIAAADAEAFAALYNEAKTNVGTDERVRHE
ncbi:MAG: prephenate dehydrogenase [Halonotius sp. J07HN6]|nr:MAG: prephenate dehydrogenase [Halonotius sp. J07HN6]ERH05623.1 MAG: prephenate dehydrogenase [Halonotius sp. J07HN4]